MKRTLTLVLALLLCAGLSGCFSISADELLALPRQPQDAEQLQEQISKQLAAGAKLVPLSGGSNREAIQKRDVDGDGVEETIIFYRRQGVNPLNIIFYRKTDNGFEAFATIEGEGDAIESIDYVDMNSSGIPEILVSWQAGQGILKALDVYRLQEGKMQRLLSVSNYSAYAMQDFVGDGQKDLLILRQDESSLTGATEMYEYDFTGIDLKLVSEAPLSDGIGAILRVRTGLLSDGRPAVYVSSKFENNAVITDIFAVRSGTLLNITRNEATGVSDATICRYPSPISPPSVTDMIGNNVLYVPEPVELPPYNPGAETQEDPFMVIRWLSFNSWGKSRVEMTTWHNYTDSWYLILPDTWLDGLTMTRPPSTEVGEKAVLFAVREKTETRDMLTIYSLTGDSRKALSEKAGRIPLLEHTDMIVAAEILPQASGPYAIGNEEFQIFWIQKDWITGELNLG